MGQEYINSELYPFVAPLPIPIANHLIGRHCRQYRLSVEQGQAWLVKNVNEKRPLIYRYMDPFVLNGQRRELTMAKSAILTTRWLLEALRTHDPKKRPVTLQTLFNWQKRGLQHNAFRGEPNPDSSAALLLARTLDTGERQWLPEEMNPEEPLWWCWKQESPAHVPTPCPVPLPSTLANATILWTPWAGGNWQQWKLIGRDVGAIRFAGKSMQRIQPVWNVTFEELQQWMPELAERPSPLRRLLEQNNLSLQENLNTFRQQHVYTLAEETLEHLAYTRPHLHFLPFQ